MAHGAARPPPRDADQKLTRAAISRTRPAFALALIVTLLFPLVGLPRQPERDAFAADLWYLYAADVVMVALTLLAAPRVARAAWRVRDAEGVTWLLLFALVAAAFALHPTAGGVDVVIRLAAAVALYRVIADAVPAQRRLVAAATGAGAIVQSAIGVLQVATSAPLGLGALGEIQEPLLTYGGGLPLARGTLGHEFILAAFALAAAVLLVGVGLRARRYAPWFAGAALAVASDGLIYGRTVALSVGLAAASLAPPAVRGRRHRWALAALLVGAGVPAIAAADGWTASFSRGVASDRGAMVGQALAIIAERPLLGVGPGNYLDVLRARPELDVTRETQNVHDVPLLVAAEAGVPAGVLTVVLFLMIGWKAVRAGVPLATLYLGYVPWIVADALPYVTPQGIVLTAVWLAFLRPEPTVATA